jgi:glycosyltransferase involved in cell wall biosynthesis
MSIVSVIIPCYNVENYISVCIASLQAQRHQDLQIICVNDGSTDSTGSVLEELKKSEERMIVISGENVGLGLARNKGLSKATGDYVLFLDADDRILPEGLARMTEHARITGADVTLCDIRYEWENASVVPFTVAGLVDGQSGCTPAGQLLLVHSNTGNKLLKRQWLLETGVMFPSTRCYEDLLWRAELAPHVHRLAVIDEPYYVYLQRESSLLHGFDEGSHALPSVLMEVLKRSRKNGLWEACRDELEYSSLRDLGIHWCHRRLGRKGEAPYIAEASEFLRKHFPDWTSNVYFLRWKMRHRLYLWMIIHQPRFVWLICFVTRWGRGHRRHSGGTRLVNLIGYPHVPEPKTRIGSF